MNTSNQLKYRQILIPLMIILSISISNKVFSQPPVLEFNIEVTDASGENTTDGELKVECNNGVPDYLFLLYDRQPVGNVEAVDKSSRISNTEFTFSGLKSGIYYVCVYDGDNNSTCYKVELGIK